MDYLFFDIECCDGNHMCSFGYVIVNSKFKIKEKNDILMNPECAFKIGRGNFNPQIELAYSEDTFFNQPTFLYFYDIIKNLLYKENRVLLGHSISSDLQYLKIACDKYNMPQYNLDVYDTQDFYYEYNKKGKQLSLDKIVHELGIDITNLQEHKSCDDAEMSMLVAKSICEKLNCSLDNLLALCTNSLRNSNYLLKHERRERKLMYFIRKMLKKYNKKENWPGIYLSNSIKETDFKKRTELIEHIFNKGYRYVIDFKECEYFVVKDKKEIGELFTNDKLKEYLEKVEIITIKDLSKMLNVEISEYGEINGGEKEENADDSLLDSALKESLAKMGITYKEWLSSFSN